MKNYKLATILLVVFFISKVASAQQPCPTNFDGNTLDTVKQNPTAWLGKMLACDVMIDSVVVGHQGKPYYWVKLSASKRMWIGSLIKTEYKKGEVVKVLGLFADVQPDDMEAKYNKDGYHILAFAFIDMNTKQLASLPAAKAQVDVWVGGAIPKVP